ncbi:MAG TPA: LptF/LptG family permease [Alphaproteobacteria bacterium]|nr:LptF/LptG family permease [Alphaproteobacteria bacterium]
MRILTRYVLKEVISHGLIGMAVFTFVIFMREIGRILELVVRNSAPIPSVAELFFLTLPTAFTITMPMGVLVGILIGLSRMAADSEVTAMRASGIGVQRFVKILAGFGLAAWVLSLANNVFIAPSSAAALARLETNMASSQLAFQVQPRVFLERFKNRVLYVEDVSSVAGASVWKNIFLADMTVPGAVKITIAEKAVVASGGEDSIRLHLTNGATHDTNSRTPTQYNITTFAETDMALTLPAVAKPAQDALPVAQMSSRELLRHTHDPRKDFARWYWIEFNRRLALPTACLVLVLIGIPLGLSARKGGKGAGFVLTIVLVFIYYFIFLTGISLARAGKMPSVLGVWMANIIFGLIGLGLLWRVDKMPIEIGLGQALINEFKRLTHTWLKNKEQAQSRPRRLLNARFPLILDDYVLRSFVNYLLLILASFLVLTLIFTFFELLSDIVRNKVPFRMVAEYLINVLPSLVYIVTPLSVLLAVLVTLGLMQKSNEITAMKATGISIYRTLVPILFIAALIAGGLFLMEQWYLPYANKRVETLKNTIKGRPAQTSRRPDHTWIFGQNNSIYYYEFYDPDLNQFGSISNFEFDPHSFQISKRIFAARAHWDNELKKWIFANGWERTWTYPSAGDPHEDLQQFDVRTFSELTEQPGYFRKEVHQSQEMNYDELSAYIRDLQQSGFDVVRLKVQLHRKLAFPLITLVMAVLAFPYALTAGRKGALTGVTVALTIAVVYWVTAGLFEAMGNTSQLPPVVAAWAPDVIFALVGGYLVLKTPS